MAENTTAWDETAQVGTVDRTPAEAAAPAPAPHRTGAQVDLDRAGLYEMAWTELPRTSGGDHRLCVVGAEDDPFASLLRSANAGGHRAATLNEAIATVTALPGRWQVVLPSPVSHGTVAEQVHASTQRALDAVQTWLGAEGTTDRAVLTFVTRNSVEVPGDKAFALGDSGLWGLVRSAQNEAPGRFRLVDVDEAALEEPAVAAEALRRTEPQLAVRADRVLLPQLAPYLSDGHPLPDLGDGTIVIAGGTGTLGRELARHLVAHGARSLALLSRSGDRAPGIAEFRAELEQRGAAVQVLAADAADPDELRHALAAVRAQRPITGVVHAIGILDNCLVADMTHGQLHELLRSKVDSALHMDAATYEDDLRFFMVFSSLSGVLGGPGQGNYAAANTFLDQFTAWRCAQGRPANAVAWGLWGEASGMTEHLDEAAMLMLRRMGVAPFSTATGMELFDTALTGGAAALVGARLAFPEGPDDPAGPFLLTDLGRRYAAERWTTGG